MVGGPGNNVCRRCKKKRPEDEPMETARYRTCKPCREIERRLKRKKKALLTGQPTDDVDLQSKKAHEIEQNIIQMARQVTNSLPQSDIQGLADAVNGVGGVDLSQHHQQQQQQHFNNQVSAAVAAAVSAATAAAAAQQGPPQIHQYDQSSNNISHDHQPMMPVQNSIDVQKDIPIDESLLKEGTEEVDASSGTGDTASLKKSPILKSEASPSTAVTGEQSDSKQIMQQTTTTNNNNNTNEDNNQNINNTDNNNSNEQEGEENKENASTGPKASHAMQATQYCLYCGTPRSIEDNGRYRLCGNCVDDPLQKANVFDDFEAYLERIELGKVTSLCNVIFIKNIGDAIPDYTYTEDPFSNEKGLIDVVNALNEKFIFRIIRSSGYRFTKCSSNFSAKPFPKTIKLLFKCKQDMKTIQKQQMLNALNPPPQSIISSNNNRKLKTEDCRSNFYISYDVISKVLNIKYSHMTHITYLQKLYTAELIKKVQEVAQQEDLVKDGYKLWLQMCENEPNEELKCEMSTIKEVMFRKDFGPLFKKFTY